MIYAYSEVEKILEQLEQLVERESKLDCMDMTINVLILMILSI